MFFQSKLKSLPTGHDLNYVSFLCLTLPVRDKSPGQVGDGFPGERDTKFRCMLQFLTVMDRLMKDNPPNIWINVSVPGLAFSGMDPNGIQDPVVRAKYIAAIQANNAAIEQRNFQGKMREMRMEFASFLIPNFLKDNYPDSEKNQHVQDIIADVLKSDPKAADLMASLLQEAGAR